MGFTGLRIQRSNMKILLTTLSFVIILQITSAQIVKHPKHAKQFLTSPKTRSKRGFFDPTTLQPTTLAPGQTTTTRSHAQNVRDQAEAFAEKYHLTSIESWEELKDKLWWNEKIPEEDKEELSGCVAKCWMKDQANDILGIAYEELKEDAEGKYEESCLKKDGCDEGTLKIAMIPCQRCTRYIPAITEFQNDDFGDMTVDGI